MFDSRDLNELTPEEFSRAWGVPQGPTCHHGNETCPLCHCDLCLAGEDFESHEH